MNCFTRKEKMTMALEEVKRAGKIIVITIMFTMIFALGLSVALTVKENRELKIKIEEMRKEKTKEEQKVKIVDTVTGRVIYEE